MVRTPLDVELIYRVAPDSAIAVERMSARPNFYETSTAMKSLAITLMLTTDSFRHMEDFVTWVDTSKLKRTIMNYNDEVHPPNPLSFHSHLTHTFSSLTTSISFNPLPKNSTECASPPIALSELLCATMYDHETKGSYALAHQTHGVSLKNTLPRECREVTST